MKNIKYFAAVLLFAGLFSSCDVNEQFDYEDDIKYVNDAKYSYSLTKADYSTIGANIQKPITDQIKVKESLLKVYKDSLKISTLTHDDSVRINASITLVTDQISAFKLDPVYLLGAAVTNNQCLNSSATSIQHVPYILNTLYKYGDVNEATAQVTFNYDLQNLGFLTAFKNASKYSVTNANYSSVGGKVAMLGAFTPSYPADNFIPGFLSGAIPTPAEGSLAVVSYNATTIEPETSDIPVVQTLFSEDFAAANLSKFVAYSVVGAQVWAASSYASISGYSGGNQDNEDWLIIPSLDLSSAVSAFITFSTAHRYAGNNLVLKYSTDYAGSGDPTAATWNNLNFNYEPGTPSAYTWTSSGNVNLPGMPNSNVSIAFVYTSTTTASSTWRVDNISVNYKDLNSDIPVSVYNKCFEYKSSNWVKTSKVMVVSPFEYDAMGAPGVSDCFTSTIPPANYLPTYLSNKLPLSFEGDTCVVVYNYGNSSTLAADKYAFTNGVWSKYTGVITKTDPFAFSSIGWVFDPTINYTMETNDYKIMVDYILSKDDLKMFADSVYKNEEFYYGFGSRYSNISFRLSYRDPFYFAGKPYQKPASTDAELFALGTTEEKVALLWKRIEEGMNIFLQLRFSDAVPQNNGVDVYYNVKAKVYAPDGLSGLTEVWVFKYKCTAAGTPPSFEFVSKTKI